MKEQKKKCTNCGKLLSFDNFHKDRTKEFGLSSQCKICRKEYGASSRGNRQKHKYDKVYCAREDIKLHRKVYMDKYNAMPRAKQRRRDRELRRMKLDPMLRLSHSIGSAMYKTLKENKNGWHWEDLVGYTQEDLRNHLMNHPIKRKGMTMDNYGEWHIDHRIPLKYKDSNGEFLWNQEEMVDPKSDTFKTAWGLDNLQPMWAEENLDKRNNYIGEYILIY